MKVQLQICLLILAFSSPLCLAQTNQTIAPEFKRFKPFIGRYSHSVSFADATLKDLNGTIEVKAEANGSVIEIIVFTQVENKVGEARWLISWDRSQKAYRVKHFTNSPAENTDEGRYAVRFKGDELILEQVDRDGDGKSKVLRFRWTMISSINLRIVTEHKIVGAKKWQSMVFNGKRIT